MRHSNQRRSRSGRSNGKRHFNNGQNRNYESNGPSSKLRGSAAQVFDKYLALARDASSAGDRVAAENFFQHAEHYFRINSVFLAEKKAKEADKPSEDSNDDGIKKVEDVEFESNSKDSGPDTKEVDKKIKESKPIKSESKPKIRPKRIKSLGDDQTDKDNKSIS